MKQITQTLRLALLLLSDGTWTTEDSQEEARWLEQRQSEQDAVTRSRGRGDLQRMDWEEAKGGRNGQNQAHTKKVWI